MSSSDPLYHGTAWPLKEGDELTSEDAPLRNYDQDKVGKYAGFVHATRNIQAAQFYAKRAAENAPFDVDRVVYNVEHAGDVLEDDPNDEFPDGVRGDRFRVVRQLGEDELLPWKGIV